MESIMYFRILNLITYQYLCDNNMRFKLFFSYKSAKKYIEDKNLNSELFKIEFYKTQQLTKIILL